MAEEYVTLDEAAELENIGYETMKKRIQRNSASFNIHNEDRVGGGKALTMVEIQSLSKKARAAYKERKKLKELSDMTDM